MPTSDWSSFISLDSKMFQEMVVCLRSAANWFYSDSVRGELESILKDGSILDSLCLKENFI